MKECGQPLSQGSFSCWNAAGGIPCFRSEKGSDAKMRPAVVSEIVTGDRSGQLLANSAARSYYS